MKKVVMENGLNTTLDTPRHGQSMVEFALILPIMVLMVAGIFDLGRAFFASITITNAAREGARYGVLNPDYLTGACDAAKNEALSSGIVIPYNNITITCGNTVTCPVSAGVGCAKDQPIIVKVTYNYTQMILKLFFPSGILMQHQVEMYIP